MRALASVTRQRARELGLALALALGLVAVLGSEPVELGAFVSCETALVVDGELRCDARAPTRADRLCPGAGLAAAPPIGAGDRIETSHLCQRGRAEPGTVGWGRMDPRELAALEQPVDVNTADEAELSSLPGVGRTIAGRIIAGRPYATVDELVQVRGIGPARLRNIRVRARVVPTLMSR